MEQEYRYFLIQKLEKGDYIVLLYGKVKFIVKDNKGSRKGFEKV